MSFLAKVNTEVLGLKLLEVVAVLLYLMLIRGALDYSYLHHMHSKFSCLPAKVCNRSLSGY